MRTMPPSEKRVEANRRNAQLSTGPITDDGKRTIRGNAVKHGLAGKGIALPKEMEAAVAVKVEAFVEALKPTDAVQLGLAHSAALASTRLAHCQRQDLANLAQRQRHAIKDWDDRREAEVLEAAKSFKDDPAAAVRALSRTAAGCDWLLLRWDTLAMQVEWRGCPYTEELVAELCRLMGFHPDDEDGPFYRFREDAFTCLPAEERALIEPETLRRNIESARKYPTHRHADGRALEADEAPPSVVAFFTKLVKDKMAALRASRDQLWREVDEPDRREAPERCLVDTSKEGMNLRRYESGFALGLHRDLRELARRQLLEAARASEAEAAESLLPPEPFSPWDDILAAGSRDEATSEGGEARNEATSQPPAPLEPPRLSPWRTFESVMVAASPPSPDPSGGGWPA
jgi:hypothetical protein